MNKSLKAKNLPLFSIIDLDQLRRENHLEGTEVTDFFTARDGKVYLLMEQPSETQGKDWLSTPSTYTAVEIQLDWAEQRVLETTLFPLGLLKFQFHYLRPAGEHFLLLGARCAYRENGPDQNAWIVSRDGAVLSRFCLGDGIQDCVVKKDGTIITSYRGKDQESILMQKNACHDFAEKKGWNIVGEEQEIGVSGYKVSTDDLVKLKRIRKAAEQGEFDILLVFMYDRLGRNLNETPFIAEWFTKKGIHVWSVYEGEIIDGVDAERMLDYIRFWQTDEAQKL